MNQRRGKTVEIFFLDANPRGVNIAEFTNRTVQTAPLPRAQLDLACTRHELANVGLYFLVGDSNSGNIPLLYSGETEHCAARLERHHQSKDLVDELHCVRIKTRRIHEIPRELLRVALSSKGEGNWAVQTGRLHFFSEIGWQCANGTLWRRQRIRGCVPGLAMTQLSFGTCLVRASS